MIVVSKLVDNRLDMCAITNIVEAGGELDIEFKTNKMMVHDTLLSAALPVNVYL